MRYTKVEIARPGAAARGQYRSDRDDLAGGWSADGMPFILVTRKAWRPPTDVYETPTDVVVKMEIAGLRDGDLTIIIADDVLSIGGRRHDEAESRKIGYHQMGISYGEFAVDIKLPGPISQDRIVAQYEAGFLLVTLPKALPHENRPVRIPVTESTATGQE